MAIHSFKRSVLGLFFLLVQTALLAQTQSSDSLPDLATIQTRIDQSANDSIRLEQYTDLSGQLLDAYRDQDARALSEKGLALARERNDNRSASFFLNRLGDVQFYASSYPNALRLYQQALDAATSARDTNRTVFVLLRLGQTYDAMKELTQAEKYLQRSLQLARQANSKHLASIYNSLAILAGKRKNPRKGIEYGNQAMAISKKNGDLRSYYTMLLNNAICYKNLQEYPRAVAAYQEILTYAIPNKNIDLQTYAYANLPEALIPLNRLDEAERYARLIIQRAAQNLASNKNELLEEAYNALTTIYRKRGNFQTALDYRDKAVAFHDSTFNSEKSRQLLELSTRYETEKKEEEISRLDTENHRQQTQLFYIGAGAVLLFLLLGLTIGLYRRVRHVNQQLADNNQQLTQALNDLKNTQEQLIQREKMASLGELIAGIAHEIQNPLNFVNNFAKVSTELVEELKEEQVKGQPDPELAADLLDDLEQNLQKIGHHGGRADAIVKGMLEHSRASTGEKQPTDLNALADEYLRLAYRGLRSRDKSFTAELVTDFDPQLGLVNVVTQDLGRVLLNLFNNAFYAIHEKQQQTPPDGETYTPTLWVRTRPATGTSGVVVQVRDNGMGIPATIRQKIYQPFFTTKPTGQGTGLGLSLSYDIITKGHGGALELKTQEREFTEFTIRLPS